MEFSRIREPVKKTGPNEFIIGDSPLNKQLSLNNGKLEVEAVGASSLLEISGINFIEYLTGDLTFLRNLDNNLVKSRYELEEAFEVSDNNEIIPSNAESISDTMWILKNETDLQLRYNIWRYNTGPEAFTDDISF